MPRAKERAKEEVEFEQGIVHSIKSSGRVSQWRISSVVSFSEFGVSSIVCSIWVSGIDGRKIFGNENHTILLRKKTMVTVDDRSHQNLRNKGSLVEVISGLMESSFLYLLKCMQRCKLGLKNLQDQSLQSQEKEDPEAEAEST